MKKNALIIGANSKIAFELSKILAKDNYNLFLLSKNYNQLKKNSVYLKQISKSKIEAYRFDISHPLSFDKILKKFCKVELLVIASGFLNINDRNNIKTNKINYLGPKNFIQKILTIHNSFKEIICFTSVSGDRIDAYLNEYSNSKKKLSNFITKNKSKFKKKNIYLKDLKLGYVKTKMTNHIFLQSIVCVSPEKVAKFIHANIGIKDNKVIYYPKIWIQILRIYNLIKKIKLSFK